VQWFYSGKDVSNVIKSLYVVENKPSIDVFFLIGLALAIGRLLASMSESFPIILISLHQSPSTVIYFLFKVVGILISFIGIVTVTDFQEDDPEQAYIPPKNFYCRYTVEPKARKLLVTLFFSHK
jgi:hypothetical protein